MRSTSRWSRPSTSAGTTASIAPCTKRCASGSSTQGGAPRRPRPGSARAARRRARAGAPERARPGRATVARRRSATRRPAARGTAPGARARGARRTARGARWPTLWFHTVNGVAPASVPAAAAASRAARVGSTARSTRAAHTHQQPAASGRPTAACARGHGAPARRRAGWPAARARSARGRGARRRRAWRAPETPTGSRRGARGHLVVRQVVGAAELHGLAQVGGERRQPVRPLLAAGRGVGGVLGPAVGRAPVELHGHGPLGGRGPWALRHCLTRTRVSQAPNRSRSR